MEDKQIVELYWKRSEEAVAETEKKYGNYCYHISYNILFCNEDAEECVNDTYIRAWNAMPPTKPNRLSAFLGKITRNLSLDRYEKYHAEKRGVGQTDVVLDELQECLSSAENSLDIADDLALKDALNRFLHSLPEKKRKIFVRRYWYLSSVKEIAQDYRMSESRVKMSLLRTRNNLKNFFEREGIRI